MKVAGLHVFSVNIAKVLRTFFFTEQLRWLLLIPRILPLEHQSALFVKNHFHQFLTEDIL